MKVFVFFLMVAVSISAFASPSSSQQDIIKLIDELKAINGHLLFEEDEETINPLLEKRAEVLDYLMRDLKSAVGLKFIPASVNKEIRLLESRIQVNTERGNELAAQRDQTKLEIHKTDQAIKSYLNFLYEASKDYRRIEFIKNKSQKFLEESQSFEKKFILPDLDEVGSVVVELKKNHMDLLQAINTYQDVLSHVIVNPRRIASVHWFQEFSLLSAITYANHFDFVQNINYKLAPFKVDTGGMLLSLVIFFLVYFSHPFVFRCTSWFIENYVITKESEQQKLIYYDVRRPVRALLIFFGLNLGAGAFFYKTNYLESLGGFSFIIYSLGFIWLFFKIIDSLVMVQIQKLSSSNKKLRKEFFNLGVQSGKGIIVIIALIFGFNKFGISLTAILSTLGVGGLAFALAAKDTLSNLFGGLTVLFDNVFRLGDWVKVGDVEGTVAEIGLRSTTIRTFDNALIIIPNSLVSVSSVMNWNRRAVGRRIKMYVGVTYESDMGDIKQAIEDIRAMLKDHPEIANPEQKHSNKKRSFKFTSQEDTHGIKSTQLVFMDRYNDFSIDILIYCFARTVQWAEWLTVKEDVLFKIAEILKKNNLEFAYPTQVRIYRPENNNGIDRGVPIEGPGLSEQAKG
jgi:MscS family membrane protein